LPILLPANPLIINDVADVADFPDLHINLAILRPRLVWTFGHRFQLQHFAFALPWILASTPPLP
jgi:hypothetical protein